MKVPPPFSFGPSLIRHPRLRAGMTALTVAYFPSRFFASGTANSNTTRVEVCQAVGSL